MYAKKSFSQNFLAAPEFIEELADAIPLKGEMVLEIGAGDGRVTEELAKRARKVIAVEVDSELIPILQKRLSKFGNVEVVRADALTLDYSPYKFIVSSLPYAIASQLISRMVHSPTFRQAALVMQLEMGKRVVAKPGSSDYSRLSVLVQARCDADIEDYIPAQCFDPIPKVDSVIVTLVAKPASKRIAIDEGLANALFCHKNQSVRKALGHSLVQLGLSKSEVDGYCTDLGATSKARVRTLTLEQLAVASKKFARFSKAKK